MSGSYSPYINVLGQKVVRKLVLLVDVEVRSGSGDGASKKESEDTSTLLGLRVDTDVREGNIPATESADWLLDGGNGLSGGVPERRARREGTAEDERHGGGRLIVWWC